MANAGIKNKTGFTPLEAKGRQKKGLMSLTGLAPLEAKGRQTRGLMSSTGPAPLETRDRKLGCLASLMGFTLMEMMVAVVISAIIAAALGNALITGFKLWQRVQTQSIYQTDLGFFLESLARRIRQVIPLSYAGFEGNERKVVFVTVRDSNIEKYTYEFDSMNRVMNIGKNNLQEIREEKTGFQAQEGLNNLEELRLSYLTVDPVKKEHNWVNSWEQSKGLPLAVRLEGKRLGQEFRRTIFIPVVLQE